MATAVERKGRLKKANRIAELLEELQKEWPKDIGPADTRVLNMLLDARDAVRRATALI